VSRNMSVHAKRDTGTDPRGAVPRDPGPGDPDLRDPKALVDYAKSLDCIHCGLCLQTCPTYRSTGAESSSPRGRIHLMRAVAEGRAEPDAAYAEELAFCLLCRHCESVCPAGVRFGEMMEIARGRMTEASPPGAPARLARWLGFRFLLPSRLRLRLAGSLLRFAQVLGLDRLAPAILGERGAGLRHLPRVPPLSVRRLLPPRVPARGPEKRRVALLEGCVMPELFAHVNRATADSLAALGVACEVARDVVCCGSLHAHNGDLEGARALARRAIESFDALRGEDGLPLPVVGNSAGCTAHLKECHHLFEPGDPWRARAEALAARTADWTEVVATELPTLRLHGAVPQPVTWDAPCHLCHGQGVRAEPLAVLAKLADVERVELDGSESCCGSAGIYSLLRPADARAVFAPKLAAFQKSGARTLVTANPGCQIQWASGLARAGVEARVVHLAELVAAGLRAESGKP